MAPWEALLLLDVILSKMKFLLKFLTAFLIFFLFFFFSKSSFAIESYESCVAGVGRGDLSKDQLSECEGIFNILLDKTKGSISSLKSEIKKYNLTIAIANAKILKSIKEIEALEEEIESLDNKIFKLDLSLDQLSELLIKRISETYKKGRINAFSLFLSSDSFSNFVSRYKYLRVIQLNDRELMLQLETARTNFKDQKTLKEEKQEELEIVKNKLKAQQATLSKYKKDKENFLAITKNDEKKYQQLLSQAIAQQKAFEKYVFGQGGATILSNQTVCDDWGCYYNQRDSQWGNQSLGYSGLSVAEYGCLVSSVAMIASHHGINIKPSDIAANPSAFFGSSAFLLDEFNVNDINVKKTHVSKSLLDSELASGRSVIAGLYGGPDHFIVIKEKSGDNYIMHDPFLENGANRLLTEKYSVSDISSLRLISF